MKFSHFELSCLFFQEFTPGDTVTNYKVTFGCDIVDTQELEGYLNYLIIKTF